MDHWDRVNTFLVPVEKSGKAFPRSVEGRDGLLSRSCSDLGSLLGESDGVKPECTVILRPFCQIHLMFFGQWISNVISTGCSCSLCGSLLNKVGSDLPFCQHLCYIRALHCCSRACTGWRWTVTLLLTSCPCQLRWRLSERCSLIWGVCTAKNRCFPSLAAAFQQLFSFQFQVNFSCFVYFLIETYGSVQRLWLQFSLESVVKCEQSCFRSKTRSRLTEPIPRPPSPLFLPCSISADHWAPSHPLQMEAKWADLILAQLLSDDHDIWQFGSYLWAACGVKAIGSNPIIMGLLSTKLCIGLFAAQGRYCHYSSFLCQEPLVSWQLVSG